MNIPEMWRSRFGPRDALEPRPRASWPEEPANIDLPFDQSAQRVEREMRAFDDALARFDGQRNRWEL